VKVEERGYFNDFERELDREVEDCDVVASHFPAGSLLDLALGSGGTLPIDTGNIVEAASSKARSFDDEETEHTGNEGTTYRRWYHHAGLLLVDTACVWTLLARNSLPRAVALFSEGVRALQKSNANVPGGVLLPHSFHPLIRDVDDLAELSVHIQREKPKGNELVSFSRALLGLYSWCEQAHHNTIAARLLHILRAQLSSQSWIDLQRWDRLDTVESGHGWMQLLCDLVECESFGVAAVHSWVRKIATAVARRGLTALAPWKYRHQSNGIDESVRSLIGFFQHLVASWAAFAKSAEAQSRSTAILSAIPSLLEEAAVELLLRCLENKPEDSHAPQASDHPSAASSSAAAAAAVYSPEHAYGHGKDRPDRPDTLIGAAPAPALALQRVPPALLLQALDCLCRVAVRWERVMPMLSMLSNAIVAALHAPTAPALALHSEPFSATTWTREELAPCLLKLYRYLPKVSGETQKSNRGAPAGATSAAASVASASLPLPPWQECLSALNDEAVGVLQEQLARSPLPKSGSEWCFDRAMIHRLSQRGFYGSKDNCACENCQVFVQFLASSSSQYECRAAEKVRSHVETQWGLPHSRYGSSSVAPTLVAETVRTGNPHMLVVRKTRSAIQMQHEENMRDVQLIRQLVEAFPGGASLLPGGVDAISLLPYHVTTASARIEASQQVPPSPPISSVSAARAKPGARSRPTAGTAAKRGRQ
jgi:hypothetical protein